MSNLIPFRFLISVVAILVCLIAGIGWISIEEDISPANLDANGEPSVSASPGETYPELYFPAFGQKDFKALGNVLFDLSHNPYFGGAFGTRHSSFITKLNALGFNVVISSDFNNLGNYAVVIEEMPKAAFSASDITLLQNYLDGGGILHVTGEYDPFTENSVIENMLSALNVGIQMEAPVVYEPTNIYNGNHIQILIYDFSDHCLNDNVSTVLHPATGYLSVDNPDSALYFSSSASYLRDYPSIKGPFPLAAIPNPTTHPDWKMVVVTDSSHFSTSTHDYFSLYDNTQLATNWVLWCDEPECEENSDCDDGVFCNGEEVCNASNECEAGIDPCPDDGLWCNGTEGCDEDSDQCATGTDPCPDDGLFCNGTEGCDEDTDQCTEGTDPCPDDGLWCNGPESCDEDLDQCVPVDPPCPSDSLFCNGQEGCDEENDQCLEVVPPCEDDGLFCNGVEECDEETDQCITGQPPCGDDETCNEELDSCDRGDDDDSDSGVEDDDDSADEEEDEDAWPTGKVSGGCCGCE